MSTASGSTSSRNTTFFRHDVRVLACAQCGGPLKAALPGALVKCHYCSASLQVGARDDRAVLDVGPRTELSEDERLRRLRAQDGRPLLPPPSLQHLVSPEGTIDPWKIQEATTVWNDTRTEVSRTGSPEAAERLYFLTLFLYQQVGDDIQAAHRKRSMLESVLDVMRLPRHRQVMLCALSRLAVFDGDQPAGEAWLASCDPRSDDLEADSHYRFSKAFLHTARGQWPGVLAALGSDAQQVPIHDVLDAACALLRANAQERVGDVPKAVALIREMMAQGGPQARIVLDKMMERYDAFGLCPVSYPVALQAHQTSAAASAASAVGGGIHRIFVPLGALFLVISAATVVAVLLDLAPAIVLPGILGGLGLTGGIFLAIGMAFKKASQKAAHLRINGLPGRGTIQSIQTTGTKINGVPMMRLLLQVQLQDGRPPYQAQVKLLASALGGAAPGAMVAIRADPLNPQSILIETD